MTDKIQKIKEWISKTQDGLMDAQGNFEYPEHEGAYHILCNLDAYIDSLQEEPAPKIFEDMLNAKTAAESLGISQEEHDKIVDECLYGKEPKSVDEDDLPTKKDYRERYKRIAESEEFRKNHDGMSIGDIVPVEGEEPVSEDLETKLDKYIKDHFTIDKEQLDRFGLEEKDYMYSMDKSDMLALVEHFTNWQKTKEEPVSKDYREKYKRIAQSEAFKKTYEGMSIGEVIPIEGEINIPQELGEYINELSKQFPDVSFAKLSRIAVRVAKWQKEKEYTCYEEAFEDGAKWKKEQFEKNRLEHCNSITNEQAELEQGFIDQHLDKHQRMPTYLDAIEYGMMMQKEQMMKDAVEARVSFGQPVLLARPIPTSLAKDGDGVKLIIIKED